MSERALIVLWWMIAAVGVVVLVVAAGQMVAGADEGRTCVSAHMVRGHGPDRVMVPLEPGPHRVDVHVWDAYAGRAETGPIGQGSERVTVAGRTTPDLADGVERADWSGSWEWSGAELVVVHEHGGSGWQSLHVEACATPTTPPTTTPPTTTASTTTTTSTTTVAPTVVLPEALAPDPVVAQPTFTG